MRHRIWLFVVLSPIALATVAQARPIGSRSKVRARHAVAKPARVPIAVGDAGATTSLLMSKPDPVAEPAVCPAGVPAETVTVINQAGASAAELAQVERAASAQSMQVRDWWGTPCVVFGPDGLKMYLQVRAEDLTGGSIFYPVDGVHYGSAIPGPYWAGEPYAIVDIGIATETGIWARAFTHELTEMDVDPTDALTWSHDGIGGLLEVCDPVENVTYQLDGVPVADFVLPAYFAGGSGPWDEAGALTGPYVP